MAINVAYVGPGSNGNQLSLAIITNASGVDAVNVADLSGLNLQQGPSMCLGERRLHIFVIDFNDHRIHEVLFHLQTNTFEHVGPVTGAFSADRTAAVYNPDTQTTHLFYQDSNVLKEATRKTGEPWTTSVVANAPSCDWGPSACLRGGAVNLAYTSNNALKVFYIQNGYLNDITPSSQHQVSIWWSPALVNFRSTLFVPFVWQNTNNINCLTNSEKTGWSSYTEINSYNCVDQGPSACIYNDEIFCFSQGSGNRLLYTIYALGSWPDDNPDRGTNFTSVKYNGNTINNVWYAPAAVSVP